MSGRPKRARHLENSGGFPACGGNGAGADVLLTIVPDLATCARCRKRITSTKGPDRP